MSFPVVDSLRSIEFETPGESRARLVDFIITGNKRATAGPSGMHHGGHRGDSRIAARTAVLARTCRASGQRYFNA